VDVVLIRSDCFDLVLVRGDFMLMPFAKIVSNAKKLDFLAASNIEHAVMVAEILKFFVVDEVLDQNSGVTVFQVDNVIVVAVFIWSFRLVNEVLIEYGPYLDLSLKRLFKDFVVVCTPHLE
jgi:hypothetical protein